MGAGVQLLSSENPETPVEKWILQKAPPTQPCWDKLSRWKEVCRWNWRHDEHNNIGETRALLVSIRHLARTRSNWVKRALLFTDSMVALGVLTKGRSPSWPLLRLARQAAAGQVAVGLRCYCRYVETKRNCADGPSRGFGIGVAPQWATDAERGRMWAEIRERRRIAEEEARMR